MSDIQKIQYKGWGWVANTAQGGAECCISRDPTPSTVVFHTSQVNGALTDCFVLGGLTAAVTLYLDGCVDANRSDSLIPQEYEMEYVYYIPVNPRCIAINA